MSRVGKQQLLIPSGTTVTMTDGLMTVKGPKGTLMRQFTDAIAITLSPHEIV